MQTIRLIVGSSTSRAAAAERPPPTSSARPVTSVPPRDVGNPRFIRVNPRGTLDSWPLRRRWPTLVAGRRSLFFQIRAGSDQALRLVVVCGGGGVDGVVPPDHGQGLPVQRRGNVVIPSNHRDGVGNLNLLHATGETQLPNGSCQVSAVVQQDGDVIVLHKGYR